MQDLLSIGTNRRESMIGTGIGLGLAGYRLNPPGVLPVLDLRFSQDKSLTAFAGPTPSFSRASSGTFFDANGVLQSAGVNAARFDHVYNGTSWVSRGLLVEEQRTNIQLRSEDFGNAGWVKLEATATSASGIAPDGNNTAYLLAESNNNAQHVIYWNALSCSSGVTYTLSFFVKASGRNFCYVRLGQVSGEGCYFDLANGTVGTADAGVTGRIQNVGNGWYRCSATHYSSYPTIYPAIFPSIDGTTTSYQGDSSKGILIWGAMLEQGNFSTSHISTTSSSVTRSADVCQITGGDFSGFWNGTEGTFACEVVPNGSGVIVNQGIFTANSGTFANVIGQIKNIQNTDGDYGAFVRTSSTNVVLISRPAGSMPAGQLSKAAFAYKQNDFADSLNGAVPLTDLSGTVPTVNQMTIGDFHPNAGTIFNGQISRLRYWNTRLENGTLRVLST